jgi:glycosyltransferase involved in cell wall biosynthesis
MNLGVLFPLGGSLKELEKHGQKRRFIDYYLKAYQKNFKQVFVFPYFKFPHRYLYTFLLPFSNFKKINQCDVLRVMQLTGVIPAIICKVLLKKPYVVTYGYDYEKFARIEGKKIFIPFLKILEKTGLSFADTVIVASEVIKNKLQKKYPTKQILLLPNSVDIRAFKPKPKTFNQKKINILFVGRLEKQKNLSNLILAISLSQFKKQIILSLIGRGTQAQKLKRLARDKAVKTKFITRVPYQKMPQEFQKADIFTLVSTLEGQPKVLIEALSCGLPTIASNISSHQEIIKNKKNGILTETSPQRIASKIDSLVKDENLRKKLSQNARKTALQKFNIKKTILKEIKLLKNEQSLFLG